MEQTVKLKPMTGTSTLTDRIRKARTRTDELFNLIDPAALYERPIGERNRIIFYLGHLEAFDWNQICRGGLGVPSFNADYDKLFEFGIDPPIGQLPQDQPADWPKIEQVREYNDRVRASVDNMLDEAPEELVHVGLEHREMHAETLAYMLSRLDHRHKLPPSDAFADPGRNQGVEIEWVSIPAGETALGKPRGDGFGWDNEFDQLRVSVAKFEITRHKITNGQYLKFVDAGGPTPPFWFKQDGEWHQRTMFGSQPLPLDWPVWVTQEQALAFAQTIGARLPSEAEYQHAAFAGREDQTILSGNANFRHWDPRPVTEAPVDNEFGLAEMVGNGWEWTCSVFEPLPGFQPFDFYPGYSANFFDGQHYVVKGGSPRTAECLLRPSFRNWFRPDYPYVFAGFRCVKRNNKP